MKTVGLIMEANPFHNGHAGLIEKAENAFGADTCIVVMSGDFVQRGEPAVLDKHLRTRMLLAAGADLVLMLPTFYSLAPAQIFAQGAVRTLAATGITDTLLFGSEAGDLAALDRLASLPEPDGLSDALREGFSYPSAMERSLRDAYPGESEFIDLLRDAPNNTLAVEYIRCIRDAHLKLTPATIRRFPASETITGASALRYAMRQTACADPTKQGSFDVHACIEAWRPYIPASSLAILSDALQDRKGKKPVFTDALSEMLRYRLAMIDEEALASIADCGKDLARRILSERLRYASFEQFADLIKVKAFTHARIRRVLTAGLLDITQRDRTELIQENALQLRVLGFRRERRDLLGLIAAKKSPSVPLMIRGADYDAAPLSHAGKRLLQIDLAAGRLYEMMSAPDDVRMEEMEKMPVIL